MLARTLHRVTKSVLRRHVTTLAAVATSSDADFTLETLELCEPRSDEVLVNIHATGICHTDLVVKNLGFASFPVVLGHEGVGVVEQVGSSVDSLKVGDRVLMTYAACGDCPNCGQGKRSYCFQHSDLNFACARPDGSNTHTRVDDSSPVSGSFFQQSSFATKAIAHPKNIINVSSFVDEGVPLEVLAPLGCGIQTGAGAIINTFKAEVGHSVAVFGCGAVGLSAVMAAKASGCTQIVAIDTVPQRLQLAEELGATLCIDASKDENTSETIKAEMGGNGVHFAVDTSGVSSVIRHAFQSLRPMGVCGIIAGSPPNTDVAVDQLEMLTQGKSLRGIIQGDSVPSVFVPSLIRLYQQGRFPFDKLITMYDGGLQDINKAIADGASGSTIKAVLKL